MSDFVNRGIIVHGPGNVAGRTFIVTGMYRSGTSLMASILRHAGIFMGSEINDIVHEDAEIVRTVESRDMVALQELIAERNATQPRWGFKQPMLNQMLTADQMTLFDRPRVIATSRDPVAMAVRRSVSEYQEPMQALTDAVASQTALFDFVRALDCPTLLISYEKALKHREDFIRSLLRFCDLPCDAALCGRLVALIEPERPEYLAAVRRHYVGLLEGVSYGRLYGWCWLPQVPDPVTVEVLVDDRVAGTVVADVFRQDLLDAGIGAGRHGFFVALETLGARPDSVIRARVARHDVELMCSGRFLREYGAPAGA